MFHDTHTDTKLALADATETHPVQVDTIEAHPVQVDTIETQVNPAFTREGLLPPSVIDALIAAHQRGENELTLEWNASGDLIDG